MRFKTWALFLVLAVAAQFALSGCGGQKAQGPIKIGMAVALTGDSSIWGQSEDNALKMWAERINKEGGVAGREIQLIPYDTRADATEAVNVAKRLIEQDKVIAIIGPAQSGVSIAISSVTEPAKVPFVATTATNPFVTIIKDTGAVRKSAFRTCFIDPFQGTVAAQFSYNRLNARKAACLYDVGSDYSSWLTQYFTEAFEKMGGKVLAKEAFRSGELDYRAVLGKLKPLEPDVLFIPTMQKEAGLAMKQARDLGMKCQFIGGDGWGSPDIFTLGGPAVEGGYLVNLAAMEDPDIQQFIKDYKAKYNADPVLPNPVMAIDALQLICDAVKRTGGKTDGDSLIKAFEETKGLKVLTGTLTIDPQTHNPLNKPAVIQQLKGGQFVFVEKYTTQ